MLKPLFSPFISFGVTNTSGRLVKIYVIYPDINEKLQSFDHLMKTGKFPGAEITYELLKITLLFYVARHFASLRIGAYSDLSSVRRQIKHSQGTPNSKGEIVKLPNKWIFLDSKLLFLLIKYQ